MPIATFMSSKAKRLQLPCEQGTLKFMRLKKNFKKFKNPTNYYFSAQFN